MAAPLAERAGPLLQAALLRLVRGATRGVPPADGDPERLADHVSEHRDNVSVHDGARKIIHRDDAALSDQVPGATIDEFSPHAYLNRIAGSGAAIYGYSGWLDAAYQNSAAKRFQNLPEGRRKLLLGPWDHGGRQNVSPFEARYAAAFDHEAEMLRFFDHHLRGADNGVMEEAPVRYFTLGAEAWRSARSWPPPEVAARSFYLDAGGSIRAERPVDPGADRYRVDPDHGTGARSRWRSLVGIAVPTGYTDRRSADERLLCYTSAPLPDDLEITGHPVARLHLATDGPDAAVFVYLEDVAPSGAVTCITEGQLRLLHRALAERPPYVHAAPQHSFLAADAAPMPPGEPAETAVELLPISYLVRRGHRLRLALGGADRDHFAPVPNAASEWTLYRGAGRPSRIELPLRG